MNKIQKRLYEMSDDWYAVFQRRLIPSVSPEAVIGVRTPELRQYAAEIYGTPEAEAFMKSLPHTYYDENNLHAFLIERIMNFNRCTAALEAFFPYIDNWATCDMLHPKTFRHHTDELYVKVKEWLASDVPYAVRFGMETMMSYYLDKLFVPENNDLVAAVSSEEYYVNMMQAWYFATALLKQYDAAIPYFENVRLSEWVHNKALQKAMESLRLQPEKKEYLRSLKIPVKRK